MCVVSSHLVLFGIAGGEATGNFHRLVPKAFPTRGSLPPHIPLFKRQSDVLHVNAIPLSAITADRQKPHFCLK